MVAYEEAKKQAQVCNDFFKILLNIYPTTIIPVTIQLLSQGKGSGVDDTIAFDVHAITELQNKGVPPTDDSFKYNYKSVSDAVDSPYGNMQCYFWLRSSFLLIFLIEFPQNLMCAPARLSQFDSRKLSMKKFPVVQNAEFFWIELLSMQRAEAKHTMKVSLPKSAMRFVLVIKAYCCSIN